jgi:hypothetical protein
LRNVPCHLGSTAVSTNCSIAAGVLQAAVFCRVAILAHVFMVFPSCETAFCSESDGNLPLVDDQKI